MLLMERAEESLRSRQILVLRVFEGCHLNLHLVSFVELAGLEEVCAPLQQVHHILVIKSELKICYSILERNVSTIINQVFILLSLLNVTIALVIFADPLLELLDQVSLEQHHTIVFLFICRETGEE